MQSGYELFQESARQNPFSLSLTHILKLSRHLSQTTCSISPFIRPYFPRGLAYKFAIYVTLGLILCTYVLLDEKQITLSGRKRIYFVDYFALLVYFNIQLIKRSSQD